MSNKQLVTFNLETGIAEDKPGAIGAMRQLKLE
jgi:hypothetical protein